MDRPLRVLMVEDVVSDALLVEHELRRSEIEFSAQRVDTRETYLEALSTWVPDLILADYRLPTFDGVTALALAREQSPGTPFIFVSGAIGEELAIEALKEGATDYVLKDRLSRLGPAVQRAMREADERQQRERAERALREQTRHLQVLHEVDRAILAARSPQEIASATVHQIRQIVLCDLAAVVVLEPEAGRTQVLAVDSQSPTRLQPGAWLPVRDEPLLEAYRRGHSRVVSDLGAAEDATIAEQALLSDGVQSSLGIPLLARSQLVGILYLGFREAMGVTNEYLGITQQVADSLAVAIHNARLNAEVESSRLQLQKLSRRLVEVQEMERRTISQELHDEAGQALTSLMLGLGMLERDKSISPAAVERVEDLKRVTDSVIEGLHRLAVNLRPASLDRLGLVPALDQYVAWFNRQGGVQAELAVDGLQGARLSPDVETTLYRVVQEALTNVVRHAQASSVSVVLERLPDRIMALVEDDGVGFDPVEAMQRGRLGLFGMRERAEMLGGTFTVESAVGHGTTVVVEVPCAPPGREGDEEVGASCGP